MPVEGATGSRTQFCSTPQASVRGGRGASRRTAQGFRRCVASQLLSRSGSSFRTSAEVSCWRDKVEPRSSAHSTEHTERSSGASEPRSGPSARPRTVGGTERITGSSMNLLSSHHLIISPPPRAPTGRRPLTQPAAPHANPHTLSIGGNLNESFPAAEDD